MLIFLLTHEVWIPGIHLMVSFLILVVAILAYRRDQ